MLRGVLPVRLGLSYRLVLDESADVPDGLTEALLVLNESYPHVVLAVFAEGPARRDSDLSVLH